MTQPPAPDSKVLFRVPEDDGSSTVETLWATALGNDEYKLDNSPFYAYSVSWEDVVYAPIDPDEGRPTFVRVVRKSGHRTIRIRFDPPVWRAAQLMMRQATVKRPLLYHAVGRPT
ncbi:MAG: DUF4265 domain-containing protein [Thermoanaerobaculia bacterium]